MAAAALRWRPWSWTPVLSQFLAAIGFAILVTARFQTDPQCFYVYHQSVAQVAGTGDWSGEMVRFMLAETWLPWGFAGYLLGWSLAGMGVAAWLRIPWPRAMAEAAWLLLPLGLLAVPALFWSDIPGTGLWMHTHFHDGRGDLPGLLRIRPRDVAAAAGIWLACQLWRMRRGKLSRAK